MHRLATVALLLTGCHADYSFVPYDDTLSLEVTSPHYGDFLGDADAQVEGKVHPDDAVVRVEGVELSDLSHGAFRTAVSIDHPYRIVDIEAWHGDQYLRRRIPVFSGHDPADTWPDGVTGRLLPAGLDVLGAQLGGMIDATGWSDTISSVMPTYESDFISFYSTGAQHDPTVVVLDATAGGIDVGVAINNLVLGYEVVVDIYGYIISSDISFGYGLIGITALATPWIDEDGVVWIELSETAISLDEPDAEFGDLEGWVVEWILDLLNDYVSEPLGEWLLDFVLSEYGTFELGGPFAFEQDLMGTMLAAELYDLTGDEQGLALGLGVAIDEELPATSPAIAVPGLDDAPDAQVAIGLHEGLLDLMIGDTLLGMLDQGMDLGGFMGDMVGNIMENLPGGEDIPDNDGWCFSIEPGDAYVVRMHEGIDPLAVLYLPDLQVDVETMQGSSCESWLEASLAVELGLGVSDDGTIIGVDLEVVEGAVLDYRAEPGWDEAEVVEGLGGFLESILSLMGGMIEINLADLLGGSTDLLGMGIAVEPRIVDSVVLADDDGTWTEGLYAVSLDVFAEE
jgi:hypothetical protein